jgi:hypothetical protein
VSSVYTITESALESAIHAALAGRADPGGKGKGAANGVGDHSQVYAAADCHRPGMTIYLLLSQRHLHPARWISSRCVPHRRSDRDDTGHSSR